MLVARNVEYTRQEVERRATNRVLLILVCLSAIGAVGALGYALFPPPTGRFMPLPSSFVVAAATLFALFITLVTKFVREVDGLSREAEAQWENVTALHDGHTLFSLFPPTQERVEAELCKRGGRMGEACRALTKLHELHPELLADHAKGNWGTADAQLFGTEVKMQVELDDAKAAFWELHSMLWRAKYQLEDSWQNYDR